MAGQNSSTTRNRRGPPVRPIRLNRSKRRKLKAAARVRTGLGAAVGFRARIILALAEDSCVTTAARRLMVDRKTVRLWRDRYKSEGVKGLRDRSRSGRPVEITAEQKCEIVAIACGSPSDHEVPFRELWTIDSLLEVVNRRQAKRGERLTRRTRLIRVLAEAELRPHRIRYWLHSEDPNFRPLVKEICQLYLAPPKGATVLCVDEKTGIQALGRKHPSRRPARGRDGRFEYEYVRNGTRKLLAAFNPHTGEVYGEVRPTRKAQDLLEFMEEVARRHPTGEVHVIWDNLNIHYDGADDRWTRFNTRHDNRFHFHYTPKHASWVNQIKLFFGILHGRVLRYRIYNALDELDAALTGFIDHWNRNERHVFNWGFDGYPLEFRRAA